jgi:hypothetical protein
VTIVVSTITFLPYNHPIIPSRSLAAMIFNMDMMWNTYLVTVIAGVSILVSVTVGFAAVGIACNCCQEICTRKEEQTRRKKEQEAAQMTSIDCRDFALPTGEQRRRAA